MINSDKPWDVMGVSNLETAPFIVVSVLFENYLCKCLCIRFAKPWFQVVWWSVPIPKPLAACPLCRPLPATTQLQMSQSWYESLANPPGEIRQELCSTSCRDPMRSFRAHLPRSSSTTGTQRVSRLRGLIFQVFFNKKNKSCWRKCWPSSLSSS